MIVTENFAFLHLHKSGGTFVNEFLLRFLPGARQMGYHLPWKLIAREFAHLPLIGLVRDPWGYYVSWYSFQSQRPQPNPLFRILSEDGKLDFESTVRNMLDLCNGGARLKAVVAALPANYSNRGLNLPGYELSLIEGSGRGFYSFLAHHMYNGATRSSIGRMERMRDELPNLLVSCGQPVNGPMREWIANSPATNRSNHGAVASYYGDSLRDLVAERDAEIIKTHGYRFGEM